MFYIIDGIFDVITSNYADKLWTFSDWPNVDPDQLLHGGIKENAPAENRIFP
jgi:hypothetical protein